MKCKKIKELITSDYIDGELKGVLKEKVEEHLGKCASCRAYEEVLRKNVALPLRRAEELTPPEEVWSNIKERIESEERVNVFLEWGDRIRDALSLRRPVFAAAVAMTLILIAAVFTSVNLSGRNRLNNYLEDQVDYLLSIDIGEANGDVSFGTAIEEYFM